MPASSMAFALAMVAWPLACVSSTGLLGARLRQLRSVGNPSTDGLNGLSHFSWCQPRPTIHSPGWASSRVSATMATISSHVRVLIRSSCIFASPTPVKWACDSIRPGIAKRPLRSITRVVSPTYAWISWLVPTAAMRSPRTAIAWPAGRSASAVATTPFVNTRSAGSTVAVDPHPPDRNARTEQVRGREGPPSRICCASSRSPLGTGGFYPKEWTVDS